MTRLERRSLLGALGTLGASALGTTAGCLEVLESDEPRPRFEAAELESVLATDSPDVVRPAPVQPSEGAVDEAIERLEALIDAVPEPLGADNVPNEAVRTDIDRTREIARNRRDALADAPDRFRAMRSGVAARRYAGEAATALEAVADGRSRDDLEAEREDLVARIDRRLAEIEHHGTDLRRTLLLDYRREYELSIAGNWLENRPRDDTTGALAVGEIGGAIEQARAAIAFVEELERRHEARLEDARSFETRFEDALDRSLEAIDAADVPDESTELTALVDADVSDTIGERVLLDGAIAFANAAERTTEATTDGETATALRHACTFERDRRAFETIRGRIEDGAHGTLETTDDVREVREAALEAAADVPFDPAEPSLGGDLLASGYERLDRIDGRIRDSIDRDRTVSLKSEYADYAVVGAQLEALSDAVAAFEDRLEP